MATLNNSIFDSGFFKLSGASSGLGAVADTFKVIGGNTAIAGSNLLSGNVGGALKALTTGVPVAQKYENTVVGKAASVITTPAFVIGAPAVAGGIAAGLSAAGGAGAVASKVSAAGSKFVSSGKAAVKEVVSKGSNAVQKVTSAKTALDVITGNKGGAIMTSPVMPVTMGGLAVVGGQNTPPYKAGTANSDYSNQTPLMPNPDNYIPSNPQATSVLNTINSPFTTPAPSSTKMPPSSKRARRSKPRSRKKASRRISKKRSTKRKGSRKKASKTIHYTKTGQPYKIIAGGKARFISKKSAKLILSSHKNLM